MNSNLKYLFLALIQRINAIVDEDNKKVFRYIDHDLGFLDEDIPALAYPAVLIDMNNFRYEDLAENCQTAEGTVSFKIIFAPYSNTSNITPLDVQDKGNRYYDHEERLHRALQGWSPSYTVSIPDSDPPATTDALEFFGSFDRLSARTDNRRKDLRIRALTYSIAFEDYGTKPVYELVPATPNITEQFVTDAELLDL